ncbi:MAG: ABC-2 type transport system permease protein [Myxococcota bacterium]|jgi:ABC-2 type transport system permease protein
MSTWRTVMRLEWRILRRDRAAVAVIVLFAGFLILSAFAGGRQAALLADGLERSAADETENLEALAGQLAKADPAAPLTAKDPRDPVWMGQHGAGRLAILPPSPLAPVSVGQRDLHPQAVRVTTEVHLTSERQTETPMSGPTRLMTGAFDPAFLFVVLFPLVVIALSYELLSGERESGTLAMLLSQPVSQGELILGKAGARAVFLSGVTVLFALVGLWVAGADLSLAGAWLHVGLYALILVVWALFWFAAAVAVNSRGGTSARSALVLVGLWLVLVVVVPGLVQVAVDQLYPVPSGIELLHQAREAAGEAEKELVGIEGRHDADPSKGGLAKRVVEVQEELARRSAPVLTAVRDRLAERQGLINGLRFVSPAILVQLALEDVAGSGAVRHHHFQEQVDAYHTTFRRYFGDRIRAGTHLSAADLAGVPVLTFQEESVGQLLMRVLMGVFGLLLAVGALILFSLPGLRRVGRLTR